MKAKKQKNISIKEVDIHMVELWYSKLQLFQSQPKVPIYLIGGTADTLEPKE